MRSLRYLIPILAVAGCTGEAESPTAAPTLAQAAVRYEVAKVDQTLGGAVSVPNSIDNLGVIAGFSNETGNQTRQAVIWRNDSIIPLGSLGGPNSNVQWPGQNSSGMIVGIAETLEPDPHHENWSCTAFFPTGVATGYACRGFVWENGTMTALPTLGGTHGFATGVNSRGQVVGWAETTVEDPTCDAPQVLQFRAVMWEPRRGQVRELAPLPGDSTSAATAINERGQAVGISGECNVAVGAFSAQHAVIWVDGQPEEIGDLGGDAWHTPMAINDRGDVVGFSNPAGIPGDAFQPLPFRWSRADGVHALPLLDGDVWGQAFAINGTGVAVGRSCGAGGCRAVLWQDGVVRNLNDLVPAGYPHRLTAARDIDDAGRITGNLVEQGSGRNLPYVATPVVGMP